MQNTTPAVEFTFPEEYVGHTTYREPPYHIVEKFQRHWKETFQPETFPGLYWGRLRNDERFEILDRFEIDRKKRPGGAYIPCPVCRSREKYLAGALVFIFSKQCIAIIGHTCVAADVKQAADRKKDLDDTRRYQEDFLMARLPKVPEMLRRIEHLAEFAVEIEHIHRSFRSGAPSLQKALRQVQKVGGAYTLTSLVDNPAALVNERLPKKIAQVRRFGLLRGAPLVRASCKFSADLGKMKQWLLPFEDCGDEVAALDKTISLLELGEARKAVEFIGEANKKLEWVRYEMSSACEFFDEYHIDDLSDWSRHSEQPVPFHVERQARGDGIAIILARKGLFDAEREYARLHLSARLEKWAKANNELPKDRRY